MRKIPAAILAAGILLIHLHISRMPVDIVPFY